MSKEARHLIVALVAAGLCTALAGAPAAAEKTYDTGASDTEIKIGNVMPYSGPASAYSAIGKTEAAYFRMINEQGGVNGRKINFISYDDSYSPPKTVEQVRKLVESDGVLLLFNIVGTPGNAAIQKYVNARKIPHIFISSGASRWNDPQNFPWSMAWWPSSRTEARIFAKDIKTNHPGKTVGVLYQNDDFGRDYLSGLRDGLGDEAARILTVEAPYEIGAVTVDSQIVAIKAANPDIFVNVSTPKYAAQAMRKIGEMGWKPVQYLTSVGAVVAVLRQVGPEHAGGVISANYMKDPADPQWKDDGAVAEFKAFMTKYYPEGDATDATTVFGYGAAKALVEILKRCGDDLTRDNIMSRMAHLDMTVDIYVPGIRITTTPTDYAAIHQLQLVRFDGHRFEPFGRVLDGK